MLIHIYKFKIIFNKMDPNTLWGLRTVNKKKKKRKFINISYWKRIFTTFSRNKISRRGYKVRKSQTLYLWLRRQNSVRALRIILKQLQKEPYNKIFKRFHPSILYDFRSFEITAKKMIHWCIIVEWNEFGHMNFFFYTFTLFA